MLADFQKIESQGGIIGHMEISDHHDVKACDYRSTKNGLYHVFLNSIVVL